jgi:hypothetical protein
VGFLMAPAKPKPAPPEPSPSWLDRVMKKRIIVHTLKGDASVQGTLMEQTADGVILRAAKLLGSSGQADTTMAGEVFIPRENVAFAQLDE